MNADERMEHASRIQEKYAQELMQKAHVVGVGVGLAQKDGAYTQDVALVVLVDKKLPIAQLAAEDLIPREIEGVRVDVQETGELKAQ